MYANLGIDHVYNWHDGHGNISPRVVRYTLHFDLNEQLGTHKLTAVTNEFGFSVKKGSECWERYASRDIVMARENGEIKMLDITKYHNHG